MQCTCIPSSICCVQSEVGMQGHHFEGQWGGHHHSVLLSFLIPAFFCPFFRSIPTWNEAFSDTFPLVRNVKQMVANVKWGPVYTITLLGKNEVISLLFSLPFTPKQWKRQAKQRLLKTETLIRRCLHDNASLVNRRIRFCKAAFWGVYITPKREVNEGGMCIDYCRIHV